MADGDTPTDDLESTELSPPSDSSAEQIGPYRLLQKLGEGGMGEVWLAEQQQPVKRKVALKVIKAGMDTKQVVARFEAERQALAMMDHPAVAKVFDAGTTPRGLPYFVMEYVKGVPITRHCDTHRLSTRERLELFQQVCEGVQHAHQKAILHRDLKPTNVLVTEQDGKRFPKIIDFGVAKATAQKLTEKTMFTELGVLIGTPEYMSPEQAELTGEDVDTRTDVYSLGVILYELLVGALPFDPKELRSGGFEGIRKRIREEEPHKPSTRLSTLGDQSTESAKCRRVDLPTLQRQLRGDLDWITMKALEKDRSRRYGSPIDLAADIERHLKHEPVLASPPSAVYRARKFVRRHTAGVVATAAGLVVLVAFAATMAVQANRIAAERDRANRERDTSDQVATYLADMLANMDPQAMGLALWSDIRRRVEEVQRDRNTPEERIEAMLASLGEAFSGLNPTDVAMRLVDEQILAPAAATIAETLSDEPRIAGRLEDTLAVTYIALELYEEAESHSRRAIRIREAAFGSRHPDTLASKSLLSWSLMHHRQQNAEAETLLREVLELQRGILGNEHPETLDTMFRLAVAIGRQGRRSEAEVLHRQTLGIMGRVLGQDHPATLKAMNAVATACSHQERYTEAEGLYSEVLDIRRRVLGPNDLGTLKSILNLARVYQAQDRHREAEVLYQEALESSRRVLGTDHFRTLDAMYNLGRTRGAQGRYAEAEALYREVAKVSRRVLGNRDAFTLAMIRAIGLAQRNQGQYATAEPVLREVLEVQRRVLGDDHPDTLRSVRALVKLYEAWGKPDQAAEWRAKLPPEE